MDDLFSSVGEDLPVSEPEPERVAGKLANSIFRPWYKQFYEGRYVQTTAHINKVLRDFVLAVVVNGDEDIENVRLAMHNIGATQRTVTPLVLQYSLAEAKREVARNKSAGVHDFTKSDNFSDFMTRGAADEDYAYVPASHLPHGIATTDHDYEFTDSNDDNSLPGDDIAPF